MRETFIDLAAGPEHEGLRLDVFLSGELEAFPSKKSAYKAIKRGEVIVNGRAVLNPQTAIRAGDTITVGPDSRPPLPPLSLTLPIVFEDSFLAVIEKPPGLPVSGNFARTVLRALPHNLVPSGEPDALPNPGPAHRLDRPTGGLLLIAKTAGVVADLGRQFAQREVRKVYHAIAAGPVPEHVRVDEPVEGRQAVTDFILRETAPSMNYGLLSFVECHPLTGRTHQIRRHLAHLGAPVVGDRQYGQPGRVLKGKGLFLWATELAFRHPAAGLSLDIAIPPPPKFATLLARESRRSASPSSLPQPPPLSSSCSSW